MVQSGGRLAGRVRALSAADRRFVVVTILVAGIGGCGLAVLAAWALLGGPLHGLLLGLLFFIGVAALIGMVVTLLVAVARRSARWGRASFILAGVCVVLLLQVPGFILGMAWGEWEIAKAKRYCERLVDDLERYKLANGQYPASLSELPTNQGDLPRLLQWERGDYYHRWRDGTFSLEFMDPHALFFGGYRYDSETGKWKYWD